MESNCSMTLHPDQRKNVINKLPNHLELKISLETVKMSEFNFDYLNALNHSLSIEQMNIYREIRYIKWMRPEFTSASFNVSQLIFDTIFEVTKKKDLNITLAEWLNIFRTLYLNYKLIKNLFLGYNMQNRAVLFN